LDFIGHSESNINKIAEWNTLKRWESAIYVDDQKNNDGIAPLHLAIKGKNLPIIKILRKYGADFTLPVTLTKGQVFRPILLACKIGDLEIVSFVLECLNDEKQAIQSIARQSFSSPVHMSAYSGSFDVLRLLVEKGAKLIA